MKKVLGRSGQGRLRRGLLAVRSLDVRLILASSRGIIGGIEFAFVAPMRALLFLMGSLSGIASSAASKFNACSDFRLEFLAPEMHMSLYA